MTDCQTMKERLSSSQDYATKLLISASRATDMMLIRSLGDSNISRGSPRLTCLVYLSFPFSRFSIFAQVSRNCTVRLKTNFPDVESGSTQKYPSRSN